MVGSTYTSSLESQSEADWGDILGEVGNLADSEQYSLHWGTEGSKGFFQILITPILATKVLWATCILVTKTKIYSIPTASCLLIALSDICGLFFLIILENS